MSRWSRTLRRRPAYVLATAGALALGVGAVTAVFTLANALLLRPLPLADPSTLVEVHRLHEGATAGAASGGFARAEWEALRLGAAGRVELAAFTGTGASFRAAAAGEAELVACQVVSARYLDLVGVRPALGRGFLDSEDAGASAPVVLLSDAFWRRRFAAARDVVGHRVFLAGRPFTVAGVLPPGFRGHFVGFAFDVWVPLGQAPAVLGTRAAQAEVFELLGRRATGQSLAASRAVLGAAWATIAPREALAVETARPIDASLRTGVRLLLAALFAIAAAVLAIAVVNAAGMILLRAEERRREVAVRRALGAGRFDLLRLALAESLALAALGGVAGLGLAAAGARLFARLVPPSLPLVLDLGVDLRVAAFACGVTLLAGAGAAVVPIVAAWRRDLAPALRASAATLVRGGRLRRAFVGGQVALALVLVVLAGLFARAIDRVAAVAPATLTTAEILWPVVGKDDAAGARFFDALLERAVALPGVESASLARRLPFGPGRLGEPVAPGEGSPAAIGAAGVDTNVVAPGFFRVLGRALLAGRDFGVADGAGAPGVAIVSETLASRLWPGASPLERTVWVGTGPAARRLRVVGVAPDGRFGGAAPRATLYVPFAQSAERRMTLLLASRRPDATLGVALSRLTLELEPDLPVPVVLAGDRALGTVLLPQRVAAATASTLAALGLSLALAGVYAVVATSVARRRREFAIRVAVGARPGDLMRLVLTEQGGLLLRAGGVGLVLAVATAMAVRGLLLGVGAADPRTLLSAACGVGTVALLASLPGARRAATVDPAPLLRSE